MTKHDAAWILYRILRDGANTKEFAKNDKNNAMRLAITALTNEARSESFGVEEEAKYTRRELMLQRKIDRANEAMQKIQEIVSECLEE